MVYNLFLYSVLINMDPGNKLYYFNWKISINTEYVMYSVSVYACEAIYVVLILYIYIYILYKVPVFLFFRCYY